MAFEEHRGDDVMPGLEIGAQLIEQIAVVGALPQMMVRVDDRQIGVEHRLGRRGGEPCLVRRVDPAELPALPGLCHRGPPSDCGPVTLRRLGGADQRRRPGGTRSTPPGPAPD
jgi:hypothetical protein